MTLPNDTAKGCGPQHLTGLPSHDWDLNRLQAYAQQRYQAIREKEAGIAQDYWLLGLALKLIRKNFQHGQWEKFLAANGIEKTRASKAMAINRAFGSVEKIGELSVEKAYERRRYRTLKKLRRGRTGTMTKRLSAEVADSDALSSATLESFLTVLRDQAERWFDEAAFVQQSDAARLTEIVTAVIARFERIRSHLRQQGEGTTPLVSTS